MSVLKGKCLPTNSVKTPASNNTDALTLMELIFIRNYHNHNTFAMKANEYFFAMKNNQTQVYLVLNGLNMVWY